MNKNEKTLRDVLSGDKDSSIKFSDLCNMLESIGVTLQRVSGSHHIFAASNIYQLLDLQPDKKDHSKAKSYQVRQVRQFINNYKEN